MHTTGAPDTKDTEPIPGGACAAASRTYFLTVKSLGKPMSVSRHMKKLVTRLCPAIALLACVLTPTATCWAQAYGVEQIVSNNDLRWFEPAELDLDGRIAPEAGFFFGMNKTGYWVTGERHTVGQEGLTVASEQLYRDNDPDVIQQAVNDLTRNGFTEQEIAAILGLGFTGATIEIPIFDDDGNQIGTVDAPVVDETTIENVFQQYVVANSIQDSTPDAKIGWGEEYRFGYSDGERGWVVEIVDGPEAQSDGTYGAGVGTPYISQSGTGLANNDPFYGSIPVDVDGDGVLDAVGPINDIFALGFGSVAVNFNLPNVSFLDGFRDYVQNINPVVTTYGPIFYIGNYGAIEDTNDPDDDEVAAIVDDLNGNLIPGIGFVVADLNGDGDIDDDEFVGNFIDFGDAYTFNVFFDQVSTRSRAELDGIEWMITHELDTSHRLERGRNDYVQFSYGVRFLRFRDEFSMEGLGSILGRTAVTTQIDNQMVGPQIALRYRRDRGKWDFSAEGRFMFGYNVVDADQNGIFGEELIPGSPNRPALARTQTAVYGERFDEFSPIAQLRLEARYKLTKALALKIGYRAQFIDSIHRGSSSTAYNAPGVNNTPGFGILDLKSDVLVNGLTFGADLRY